MEKINKEREILLVLFKDILSMHNSRTLAKIIGISHPGAFKILKKLEGRDIVRSRKVGRASIYYLNFDNDIAKKEIELALLLETNKYKKWVEEFKQLKEISNFVVLFGSIIKNEREAKDIDLLIISKSKEFKEIKRIIEENNNLLNKRVHPIIQSEEDFIKDLLNKNKVTIEIIKTGIILYNPESMISILEKNEPSIK